MIDIFVVVSDNAKKSAAVNQVFAALTSSAANYPNNIVALNYEGARRLAHNTDLVVNYKQMAIDKVYVEAYSSDLGTQVVDVFKNSGYEVVETWVTVHKKA